jgi:hypothetical protein
MERYRSSQLAKLLPGSADDAAPDFLMGVTNGEGQTVAVTVSVRPMKDREDPSEQHRGVRIWRDGDSMEARLGASTVLRGPAQNVMDAIDRWSRADMPLSAAANKSVRLSSSYDAWFLAIKPLDVPVNQTAAFPLKYHDELVQAIDEVRAGLRLGPINEAVIEVDAKSSDEAMALAVIGRYLPGILEMGNARSSQAGMFSLADRLISKSEGRTASLSFSVAETRLEEWLRAQRDRERERER